MDHLLIKKNDANEINFDEEDIEIDDYLENLD